MGGRRVPIADRFWAKVDKGGECWIWTASRNRRGYGRIGLPGYGTGYAGAHRLSWELHNGPIPSGLFVCHRCDNPPCVRPEHLFLGTNAENLRDMRQKGRSNRGERNGNARLTAAQILEIRLSTEPRRVLAKRFGVHVRHVYALRGGVFWPHVATEGPRS